ncbi:MAG: hypothetical protein ACK4FL_03270 [Microgenomates group bacterium]
MANIKIISATQARNNWFEILNWVNIERKEVWIRKNDKVVAKILPGDKVSIENMDEVIKKTFGYLKGKKGVFPYQEDKKVIIREKKANDPNRLWKNR